MPFKNPLDKKAYYNKLIVNNICCACAKNPTHGNRYCPSCNEKKLRTEKEYRQNKYKTADLLSLCRRCLINTRKENSTLCIACADRMKNDNKSRRNQRKLNHECVDCGTALPKEHQTVRCDICTQKHKEYKKSKRKEA